MPRHRSRQNATHELTATRETDEIPCDSDEGCPRGTSCDLDSGVCVDGYGTPVPGSTTVIEAEEVEYKSVSVAYIRGDTGERERRAATISGRGALAEILNEGDDVKLVPLDEKASEITGMEVRAIITGDDEYGRRSRVGSVTIELGGV